MEEKPVKRPLLGNERLKKIRPELKSMAYMAAHGASHNEIGQAFRITKDAVRHHLNSTIMKSEVERIRAQIYGNPSQRIKAIIPEAIEVEYGIMKDETIKPNVRHAVAKNFIEQGLGKPKQNIQVDGGFTIRNLFERLDQARLPQEQEMIEIEAIPERTLSESRDNTEVADFMKEFTQETNYED